jgi:hypothetical protein
MDIYVIFKVLCSVCWQKICLVILKLVIFLSQTESTPKHFCRKKALSKSIVTLSPFVSVRCHYSSTVLHNNLWNIITQEILYLRNHFSVLRLKLHCKLHIAFHYLILFQIWVFSFVFTKIRFILIQFKCNNFITFDIWGINRCSIISIFVWMNWRSACCLAGVCPEPGTVAASAAGVGRATGC